MTRIRTLNVGAKPVKKMSRDELIQTALTLSNPKTKLSVADAQKLYASIEPLMLKITPQKWQTATKAFLKKNGKGYTDPNHMFELLSHFYDYVVTEGLTHSEELMSRLETVLGMKEQ